MNAATMEGSRNLLIVFSLMFSAYVVYGQDIRDRDQKILSVFQVVSFPNDVCVGSTKNGTCYTSSECSSNGGTSDGSCANGYGVCCIFTINCGAQSSQNCTYFESSGVTSGNCRATICPCSTTICQLRLDFITHVITGPSTLTTTATKILNGAVNPTSTVLASLASQCLTDSFSVTNPGGGSNPVLCGTNTGEHMYVDASDACNELNFQLGTNPAGVTGLATRSWSIKATQYDCNSRSKAPAGCTQYFSGATSGVVRSYNYAGGYHLANQNQKICVRRERGNCRICWSTTAVTDFAVSGMAKGIIGTCCGYAANGKGSNYDCVQIPSASKAADKAILPGVAGFCGINGLVTVAGTTSATVCSMRTPFELRFITDSYEVATSAAEEAEGTQKGFELNYVMSC